MHGHNLGAILVRQVRWRAVIEVLSRLLSVNKLAFGSSFAFSDCSVLIFIGIIEHGGRIEHNHALVMHTLVVLRLTERIVDSVAGI